MARPINKLNVKQVASLKTEGRHADGGGLYLRVSKAGTRSWVFMHVEGGKRSEIGLGSAQSVSLASARRIAGEMREAVAIGGNPRQVLTPAAPVEMPRVPTFGEFAEDYISSVEAGWKNPVHRQQWRSSLRDHAQSMRDMPIDEVGTDDVLAVLKPIWLAKSETAKRVRGRIEKILDAAKARGHRPRDAMNPAAWRGHLSVLLPAPPKLERGHHAALPWQNAPAFVAELRQREAVAARCLEFVILTAARSGEALGATWGEVDMAKKLWTVPPARMKAGAEHVVPLSQAAVDLLERVKPAIAQPEAAIFGVGGAARSNMAIAMLLRRMKHGYITTHGFRSTFRDWAGDATDHPRELIEAALAHTLQNKAERAYRRGTAVERRRVLMEDWAAYLLGWNGDATR
jgi:integrase